MTRGKKEITTMEITMVNAVRIKEKADKDQRNISDTINEILEGYFRKEDLIQRLFSFYSHEPVVNNTMTIKDRKLRRLIDVRYMEFNPPRFNIYGDPATWGLLCELDDSDTCKHTLYAWMTLDIGKLDLDFMEKMEEIRKREKEERERRAFENE